MITSSSQGGLVVDDDDASEHWWFPNLATTSGATKISYCGREALKPSNFI